MKRYIIDGYNLLFKNNTTEHTFARDRLQLISKLSEMATLLKLTFTVVFDAHSVKDEGSFNYQSTLRVIFTPYSVTADEWIQQEIRSSDDIENIVVVTGDRLLAHKVRLIGASVISVETFLDWLQRRAKNKRRPPKEGPKQNISTPLAEPKKESVKIFNDPELQRYWEMFNKANEECSKISPKDETQNALQTTEVKSRPKKQKTSLNDEEVQHRYLDIFEKRWQEIKEK